MTAPNVFGRHIHQHPDNPHRCVLLDERHLRCIDCKHTLVLPSGVGSTSTSTRSLPSIDDPDACPLHPGEWARNCGPCRSEHLAVPDGQTKTRPDPEWAVPPTPEYLAAAAQLREAQAGRARELDGEPELPTTNRDEIRRRIDAEQQDVRA